MTTSNGTAVDTVEGLVEELLEALIELKEAVDWIASSQCEAGENVEWWNRYTGGGWQAAVKADAVIAKAQARQP